jgi:hypothetical protein
MVWYLCYLGEIMIIKYTKQWIIIFAFTLVTCARTTSPSAPATAMSLAVTPTAIVPPRDDAVARILDDSEAFGVIFFVSGLNNYREKDLFPMIDWNGYGVYQQPPYSE